MEGVEFEGYIGFENQNIAFSEDMMLVIVLILLTVFACIFRLNTPLIGKMIHNINAGERLQSIFETTEKDSFLYNSFMTFQALLLVGIFLSSVTVKYKFIIHPTITTTFITIGLFLVLFLIYYLFKRILYTIPGIIFMEKSTNKMLLTNYQALFSVWGVALYIPVLWILLFGINFYSSIIVFIIIYLLFKIILTLRFIHIFYRNNTGILFLSLYLCAQEIAPMVFLYQGIIFTYNIIEKNNTWQ